LLVLRLWVTQMTWMKRWLPALTPRQHAALSLR
jgi:hypothetical protein